MVLPTNLLSEAFVVGVVDAKDGTDRDVALNVGRAIQRVYHVDGHQERPSGASKRVETRGRQDAYSKGEGGIIELEIKSASEASDGRRSTSTRMCGKPLRV